MKTFMKKICPNIILLFAFGLSLGRSPSDSILDALALEKNDSLKIIFLNKLSTEYRGNDPEKSLVYANPYFCVTPLSSL